MPKFKGYPSWSNRKLIEGSHRMNAWDDTSAYEVPVVVIPGASVEEALRDAAEVFRSSDVAKVESSWGKLRWSGGCRILRSDHEKRALIVQETVCLCD